MKININYKWKLNFKTCFGHFSVVDILSVLKEKQQKCLEFDQFHTQENGTQTTQRILNKDKNK